MPLASPYASPTYGDRNCSDEDGRTGMRSAVKSGGCCAAKTTPPYKTFALRQGDPAPTEASEAVSKKLN